MSLRIGIDASCWWNKRGFGRYTRLLLSAMFEADRGHEYILFADQPATTEMQRSNVRVVNVRTNTTVAASAVADRARSLGDIFAFRASTSAESLDVMYFPAVYSWFPAGGRTPTVVTFHDAIAEHYPTLVFPNHFHRFLWNTKVWLAKRSARCITTVSEAARAELARYLHIDPRRIHVVLEAADPRFHPREDFALRAAIRERFDIEPGGRMLLFVGGMAPHKNLVRLLEAFRLALKNANASDLVLVLAGDPAGGGFHSNYAELRERVDGDPALSERVRFIGFVHDEDLVTLYSDAWIVALPSLSEGFGLPAAEAIACGTPVICAAGGAVEEVVARAGAFFDPLDVADMTRTIVQLASDSARVRALRAACAERAAQLSWRTTASQILDILEICAGKR